MTGLIEGVKQLDEERQSGMMLFMLLEDGKEYNGVKNDWNMV